MKPVTYLDNNATTEIAPGVLEVMVPLLRDGYGNPSSVYGLGREAAKVLEKARSQVAALAGSREDEIIFPSCGTESINTAIQSAIAIDPDKRHIITSAVEHSATVKLCEHLAQRGYEITWLPVDSAGLLDLERLTAAIRPDTALITLLWAARRARGAGAPRIWPQSPDSGWLPNSPQSISAAVRSSTGAMPSNPTCSQPSRAAP